MTLDGEEKIFPSHAVAIIANADEALAAIPENDLDCRSVGIDGVLHELFHDACRRSMTSPAAIRLTVPSESRLMAMGAASRAAPDLYSSLKILPMLNTVP